MIGQLSRLTAKAARQRADELLEQFDLTAAASRAVKTYSGGMRRRLDLAACLIGHPAVLFLDEPTTGLDPSARALMWDIVRQLVADGTTLLLTTQYLDEADVLASRVAVIDGGKVIAEGTPAELKASVGGQRLLITLADGVRRGRRREGARAVHDHAGHPERSPTRSHRGSRDRLRRAGHRGGARARRGRGQGQRDIRAQRIARRRVPDAHRPRGGGRKTGRRHRRRADEKEAVR